MEYINATLSTIYDLQQSYGVLKVSVIAGFTLIGCLTLITTIYTLVPSSKTQNNKPKNKTNTKYTNAVKSLQNLQSTILKDHATIDGLTLLVGALSKKTNDFETKLSEIEDFVDNDLVGDIKEINSKIITTQDEITDLNVNIEKNISNTNDLKSITERRFKNVQTNFTIMTSKLGNIDHKDYDVFVKNTTDQLLSLRDAIFVPIGDDTDEESIY